MFPDGRPENTHIYDEKRFARKEATYNYAPSGPAEITHVVLQNAIFVKKSRVAGDPDRGGPVGASRASLR